MDEAPPLTADMTRRERLIVLATMKEVATAVRHAMEKLRDDDKCHTALFWVADQILERALIAHQYKDGSVGDGG